MEYQPGAALCNLFLADELNRATSRTQSALLEAMEEGQVTVDGVSHPVPRPFVVIATQNPAGAAGTQLLPDSQMDRFMVRLSMGYPAPEAEKEMLRRKQGGNPLERVEQVVDHSGLLELQRQVDAVHLSEPVLDYIVALVGATRVHPMIEQDVYKRQVQHRLVSKADGGAGDAQLLHAPRPLSMRRNRVPKIRSSRKLRASTVMVQAKREGVSR